MRETQDRFFKGDRSVVAKAKKQERQVDDAITRILMEAGYTKDEFLRRPPGNEQKKLF